MSFSRSLETLAWCTVGWVLITGFSSAEQERWHRFGEEDSFWFTFITLTFQGLLPHVSRDDPHGAAGVQSGACHAGVHPVWWGK